VPGKKGKQNQGKPSKPERACKNHMHVRMCVILSLPLPFFSFELPTLDTCKKQGVKSGGKWFKKKSNTCAQFNGVIVEPSAFYKTPPKQFPKYIYTRFFLFFPSWGNEVFPVWLRVSHCGQINAKRYVNQIKSKARTAPHTLTHTHTIVLNHTHMLARTHI